MRALLRKGEFVIEHIAGQRQIPTYLERDRTFQARAIGPLSRAQAQTPR